MRARLVVFPIRGRNWCFGRSIDPSASATATASQSPSTFKELWKNISSDKPINVKAELVVDFVTDKMNKGWIGLEKAPEGSLKNKVHGVGLKLLSRVKPSEIFLKSISKEVTGLDVIYPSRFDARVIRQRLRHIAMRGTIIHKKYFYGSISMIPFTSVFMVLPLPNIPFFWMLFRSYSHWRALQGSEKLFRLISHSSNTSNTSTTNKKETDHRDSIKEIHNSHGPYCVFQPSEKLEDLTRHDGSHDGLSKCAISKICKMYDLDTRDVIKYKDYT